MSDSNNTTPNEAYRQTTEQLSTHLSNLNSRLDTLERRLEEVRSGAGEETDTTELEESITKLRAAVEENSIQLTEVQNFLDTLEDEVTKLKTAGSGGSPDLGTTELVGNPDHTEIVKTGRHQDDGYHEHGGWGLIVNASRPVHWRSALVNAQSSGTTRLELYSISKYNLGELHKTRELMLNGGEHTVYPEVTIPKGTWFITRDAEKENPIPIKRVDPTTNWSELNKSTGVPITFRRTWQIGREEGSPEFEQYQASGWHNIFHYWANMEFGYMDQEG